MRLATFNLENMFERPIAMNLPSVEEGRQVLTDYNILSNLIQIPQYSQNDKDAIMELMKRYNGLLKRGDSKFIRLIGAFFRHTFETYDVRYSASYP